MSIVEETRQVQVAWCDRCQAEAVVADRENVQAAQGKLIADGWRHDPLGRLVCPTCSLYTRGLA